jgi:hypothetical protein
MEPAERVALLALVYREFTMGKRDGAPGDTAERSLLKKMASYRPVELDAMIFDLMTKCDELGDLMIELAGVDELRYEALLHAWPSGLNNDPPPDGPWEPYRGRRWDEVEEAMREVYKTGVTHSPSFIRVIAEEAYAAALAQAGPPA